MNFKNLNLNDIRVIIDRFVKAKKLNLKIILGLFAFAIFTTTTFLYLNFRQPSKPCCELDHNKRVNFTKIINELSDSTKLKIFLSLTSVLVITILYFITKKNCYAYINK
jgi:hypothetical protein